MGCDIHIVYEVKVAGMDRYSSIEIAAGDYTKGEYAPLDYRSYSLFAFLANVRNYSAIRAISMPRGLPADSSPKAANYGDDCDYHAHSWLFVNELVKFDYGQAIEDRRSNGSTLREGCGEITTYREFLGKQYFADLQRLVKEGVDRIVFCFDC